MDTRYQYHDQISADLVKRAGTTRTGQLLLIAHQLGWAQPDDCAAVVVGATITARTWLPALRACLRRVYEPQSKVRPAWRVAGWPRVSRRAIPLIAAQRIIASE